MTGTKPNSDSTKEQSAKECHDKAAASHDQASLEHMEASKCCASNDVKGAKLHSDNAKSHAEQAVYENKQVNKHYISA